MPVNGLRETNKQCVANKIFRCAPTAQQQAANNRLLRQLQLDASFVHVVEMAIGCGVIRDVNMDVFGGCWQQFVRAMAERGMSFGADAKKHEQMFLIMRTMVLASVTSGVFASQQQSITRESLPHVLRKVELRLMCSIDVCLFAFTMLEST